MARGQLWLFPPSKPLVERFGETFFRNLPACPGVYLLCGPNEGVLYVGKARNLRKRLATYRVANPERFPRRIIRLLHQVTRIEWDECRDERTARFREELLIGVLQPRFNRAGVVWPRRSVTNRLPVVHRKFTSKETEYARGQYHRIAKASDGSLPWIAHESR